MPNLAIRNPALNLAKNMKLVATFFSTICAAEYTGASFHDYGLFKFEIQNERTSKFLERLERDSNQRLPTIII